MPSCCDSICFYKREDSGEFHVGALAWNNEEERGVKIAPDCFNNLQEKVLPSAKIP